MDSPYITADYDTLSDHALNSATKCLCRARSEIDKEFGTGYAEQQPGLVAAYVSAAIAEMNAVTHAKVYGAAIRDLAESLFAVATSLNSDG